MAEMVERVARALCMSRHGGYPAYAEARGKDSDGWKRAWWDQAMRDAHAVTDEIFANDLLGRLETRVSGIEEWLADESPYVGFDQKHTAEGTPERAYWHHGYMMAIRDVLRAIRQEPSDAALQEKQP